MPDRKDSSPIELEKSSPANVATEELEEGEIRETYQPIQRPAVRYAPPPPHDPHIADSTLRLLLHLKENEEKKAPLTAEDQAVARQNALQRHVESCMVMWASEQWQASDVMRTQGWFMFGRAEYEAVWQSVHIVVQAACAGGDCRCAIYPSCVCSRLTSRSRGEG